MHILNIFMLLVMILDIFIKCIYFLLLMLAYRYLGNIINIRIISINIQIIIITTIIVIIAIIITIIIKIIIAMSMDKVMSKDHQTKLIIRCNMISR